MGSAIGGSNASARHHREEGEKEREDEEGEDQPYDFSQNLFF